MKQINQEYFDRLLEAANRPGLFSVSNGIRVTRCWQDYAEGELTIQENSGDPQGFVHSGCLSTLMDTVSRVAASTGGRASITLNCTLNYINPAPVSGKTVLCQTTKIKTGRTIAVYSSVLTDDSGQVIASATHTFFLQEEG